MNGQFEPDEEYKRRQRGRNVALGLILLGLAILFFLITLVRLGGAA